MAHNLCPLFFTFFWFFCGFKIDNDERSTCNSCPLLLSFVLFFGLSFVGNIMFIMMFYDHLILVLLISCNVGFIVRLLFDPSMLTLPIGCIVEFTIFLSFTIYSFCHFVAKSPWVEKNVLKREFMLGFQILVLIARFCRQ